MKQSQALTLGVNQLSKELAAQEGPFAWEGQTAEEEATHFDTY